jgi:CRP-like cAMP-binding protein
MSTPPGRPGSPGEHALDGLDALMRLPGDEAVLPAGSRLADEHRPGHQCFVILDGTASVERNGRILRRLGSGAFVGDCTPDGRPLAPSGVTIRLGARSRVLVLDSVRLAAALDADPTLAATWRSLISRE